MTGETSARGRFAADVTIVLVTIVFVTMTIACGSKRAEDQVDAGIGEGGSARPDAAPLPDGARPIDAREQPDASTLDGAAMDGLVVDGALPDDAAPLDGTAPVDGTVPLDGETARCGNGTLEPAEECDDGTLNSDAMADACRTNCTEARCGDAVRDTGERCDDGNSVDTDACKNDCSGAVCTGDEDCDDGLFCNGSETCVAGSCMGGSLDVDDGIGCTLDGCDESTASIVHLPDPTPCEPLGTEPYCASSGPFAGRLVRDIGECDVTTGCVAATELVDDCLDDIEYPTSEMCSGTDLLQLDGTCVDAVAGAPAHCDYASAVQQDCTDLIPSPHPYCEPVVGANSFVWHHSGSATCNAAELQCEFSESTTTCTAPGPTCSGGELETRTATCSDRGGCGTQSSTTSCRDAASRCDRGPVLVTYTPTCGSRTTCGAPTETRTRCTTPAPACIRNTYTVYRPACDATTERCGSVVASSQDCSAATTCSIFNLGAGCIIGVVPGICTDAGCAEGTATQIACPNGGCTCSGTPRCTR